MMASSETNQSDLFINLLLLRDKDSELRSAISLLKKTDYLTILERYSGKEELVHINALIIELHHVPLSELVLYAGSPLTVISGIYHSFLWYARYCIVNACSPINPPPSFRFTSLFSESGAGNAVTMEQNQFVSERKQDELFEMCLFLKSALFDLMEKADHFPLWYKATCCQIAYEIGNYYWMVDEHSKTIEMLNLCQDLLTLYQISVNPDCIWIDFEVLKIEKIIKVCNLMIGNHQPTTLTILTSYLVTKEYQDPQLFTILMADICEQSISLRLKRIILQDSLRETPDAAPKIALSIALCVSHILLTADKENEEHKGLLSDKTSTTIGKIKREVLPMDTNLLLDILEETKKNIPIELVEEWTFMWQVLVFVKFFIPHEKSAYDKYANHPFIENFIKRNKDMLPVSEQNEKMLKDRSQSSVSYDYFLREMLFTNVLPGEKVHVGNLATLVSQKGAVVIPHLLNLAKKHVNNDPLIALELVSICQNTPPELYSKTEFSYQTFEREFVTIQSDAVICGLVDKAQELLNEGQNVESIVSQFFETEDLMKPSSLLLFHRALNVMISTSRLDLALSYTNNVFSRMTAWNPLLANSILVLGKSLSLLYQVEANLVSQNVLTSDGNVDWEVLNNLENEPASQYSMFSLQLLNWICDDILQVSTSQTIDDAKAIQMDVFKQLVSFFTRSDRHPVMIQLFIGSFGGRLARHLPKEKGIEIGILGPGAVFSIPFKGFSSEKETDYEAPLLIQEKLNKLLLVVRHDDQVLSADVIEGGLKFLKLILEAKIQSKKDKQKGDYWLLGDINFAFQDYDSAIRIGTFFKRMAKTLVHLKNLIPASFFLQLILPSPPYKDIFSHLSKSIHQIAGSISKDEIMYDPPWKQDASPAYSFFDIHVIEFIVSSIKQKYGIGKEEKVVQMLIARLKSPVFDPHDNNLMNPFILHLFNWNIQRLCVQYA